VITIRSRPIATIRAIVGLKTTPTPIMERAEKMQMLVLSHVGKLTNELNKEASPFIGFTEGTFSNRYLPRS
jgi:hypothetical protein